VTRAVFGQCRLAAALDREPELDGSRLYSGFYGLAKVGITA